jgi:hypothetical protein
VFSTTDDAAGKSKTKVLTAADEVVRRAAADEDAVVPSPTLPLVPLSRMPLPANKAGIVLLVETAADS